MTKIFLTADWHFGHRNIIRLSQRPFKDIKEHDETIIKNVNEVVDNDDILYILGDLGCYKDLDLLRSMLQRINGRKFVIIGNHDSRYNLIQLVREKVIEKVEESKTIQYGKNRIFLAHFPYREWPHFFKGSFMAYGHCHNNLKDYERSTDVGVDAWNYYPVYIEDFLKHFEKGK